MKRCQEMVDVGRRKFLSGAGIVAASVATANVSMPQTKAARRPFLNDAMILPYDANGLDSGKGQPTTVGRWRGSFSRLTRDGNAVVYGCP
jgi:hypothetical protein